MNPNLVGYFRMPVAVEIHYMDGSTDSSLLDVEGQVTTAFIPNPLGRKIAFVLFDPGSRGNQLFWEIL